jgi:hypothetical protein
LLLVSEIALEPLPLPFEFYNLFAGSLVVPESNKENKSCQFNVPVDHFGSLSRINVDIFSIVNLSGL